MRRGSLILLLILGCDDAGSPAPGTPGVPPPGSTGGGTQAVCSGKQTPQNDQMWTMGSRQFRVHLPPGYDPTHATPVVLNFHGYTSNADQEIALSGMNNHADAHGYVAVYPNGTGTSLSWNAGGCCGDAAANHTDDIAFTRAMIAKLENDLCIDAHRIYATGMSNGGMFSHRLACEMSDTIAAVAPVAGTLVFTPCNPARPMPVMHFHGTSDSLVPYGGNPTYGMPPVTQMMQTWAERDRCAIEQQTTYLSGDTTCGRYPGCAGGAEVILCTIDGGGHTWPGGLPVPALGKTTMNADATAMMWDFFVAHPLP